MSAADELEAWMKEHRPELLPALREMPLEAAISMMNAATGLLVTVEEGYKHGPEHVCRLYLTALKLGIKPAPPTTPDDKPSKPPPALPVEAWHSREFDADQAHAATLSLCRGQ